MPEDYGRILRERYGIQLKRIAGDTDVTGRIIGHAQGYNEISNAEITRRFGAGVLREAEGESFQQWKEKSRRRLP